MKGVPAGADSRMRLEIVDLARRYRARTGRPLGVTGEVAELMALEILGGDLAPLQAVGHDIVTPDGTRWQVKGRVVQPGQPVGGQRISKVRSDGYDRLLVLVMNSDFEVVERLQVSAEAVEAHLDEPGSKARNERRAPSISALRALARREESR